MCVPPYRFLFAENTSDTARAPRGPLVMDAANGLREIDPNVDVVGVSVGFALPEFLQHDTPQAPLYQP